MQAMRAIGRVAMDRLSSGQEMPSMEEFVEMMAENPEFAGGEAITTDRLVEMFAMRGTFASEEDEDDESEEDEDDESEEEEDDERRRRRRRTIPLKATTAAPGSPTPASSDEESNDFDDFEAWRQERRAREFGLSLQHELSVRNSGTS